MTVAMPWNEDAEKSVIGAVFLQAEAYEAAGLRADEFQKPAHQAFWEALGRIRATGAAPDPLTVEAELSRAGQLEAAGGIAAISSFVTAVPTADGVRSYAEIVRGDALTRRVRRAAVEIASSGLDREDLHKLATSLIVQAGATTGDGFRSASERVRNEEEERRRLVARMLPFGVRYFDDALGGILPHDLVLLGARTGAGKTELATGIAQRNAEAGRVVSYFALEAEPNEIERRAKYRTLVDYYYQRAKETNDFHDASRLSYRAWYLGQLEDVLGEFSALAEKKLARTYRTLRTFYRGVNFDGGELERHFRAAQSSDLIVLDHLHYVDVDEEESENRATGSLIKRIRDLGLTMGVPVIAIAHLRKRDRRGPPQLLPDLEDFHGTSNLTKIVTIVITLGPAPRREGDEARGCFWPTYLRVCKDRMEGSNARYVSRAVFDARLGRYRDEYEIGWADAEQFETLPEYDMPRWARSAA